ncbi:MAG TPA: hypothetical protein VMC83_14860 [Streptosporangiaceae bacterium]|nr:hypothetical protein [Streptosporangiaceae bacterium]
MDAVPSTIEQPAVAEPARPRDSPAARLVVLGCYLLGAVAMTGRLWLDPAGRMQVGDRPDVNLFAWFLRYSATAIGHGHLPALFTTALGAPRGVNLMWNTAFLLPGILLTPVTLLAGPQVSLTLVLTLSFAGSAAALFWVLRRWGASLPAAAVGGAVYGFSPALVNSGLGHYQLVFAVLPPLIIDALLRVVTGRQAVGRGRADQGRQPSRTIRGAVRTGAWLGLLAAAQLLTGEELLVYTAVAGLFLVGVIAFSHPRLVPERAGAAAAGLLSGAAVMALICGYPLWVQFRGPLREHSFLHGSFTGNPAFFVDPSGNVLFHSAASAYAAAHYYRGLPEVLTYLGWPLIAVLVAAAVCFWRDVKVRATAVTCALLELCSLGGAPLSIGGFRLSGSFLPYHWLQGLPTMAQVLPGRFGILGAGAAGAVLAFSLDRTRPATVRACVWRRSIPFAVAALAVVPLIPLPYHSARVSAVPAGWQASFTRLRLPPDARVLMIPVPLVSWTVSMRWQADTGEPASMIGGYFSAPEPDGEPLFTIGPTERAAVYLNQLRLTGGRPSLASTDLVRSALADWRPAAVVAVIRPRSRLARFLASLLGPPAFRVGRVLVWRHTPPGAG